MQKVTIAEEGQVIEKRPIIICRLSYTILVISGVSRPSLHA
jgi:hypothetical protein